MGVYAVNRQPKELKCNGLMLLILQMMHIELAQNV